MEGTRTRGRQNDTMIDWMKSNDVEYEHIKKTEKTGVIGGLDLPEKAEHTRERDDIGYEINTRPWFGFTQQQSI